MINKIEIDTVYNCDCMELMEEMRIVRKNLTKESRANPSAFLSQKIM